jgi:hypothetical protein
MPGLIYNVTCIGIVLDAIDLPALSWTYDEIQSFTVKVMFKGHSIGLISVHQRKNAYRAVLYKFHYF